MSLAFFAPVLEWVQQLRVHSSQASQILGIDLIGLTLVGVDEPQLPGIGHQYLVAALLEHSTNPGRMGSRLHGYAHRPLRNEATSEGFGSGSQPTLFHNLAALLRTEA